MIPLREDAGNARRVPGSRWLVRYQDDLAWWQERLGQLPQTDGWYGRPTGDQYDEDFGDYEKMVPLNNSGRYPDGVVQVVSFSRGLTRDEMRECVSDGRDEAERVRAAERLKAPQEPTTMIGWWGAEEAVPGLVWRLLATASREASGPASHL